MATDIGEELLKKIEKAYGEEVASNTRIKSVLSKIENKSATYSDVLKYASELGDCLASAIRQNVSESVLPDGKMYYNIAKTIMEPMMQLNYQNIATQCDAVQTILNESAGLSLKAVTPSYNQARTESLINYISMADNYSDREKSFLQYISNDARMIVDNAVQGNADFHYKSGLNPQIVRRTSGLKPCKWCQSMAGVYNYYEVNNKGNEVFRRHSNCNCTVTYDPGDNSGQVQDVWSKTWRNAKKIEERKQQISLASRVQSDKIKAERLATASSHSYMSNKDKLYRNMKKVPSLDGYTDIACHSDATTFTFQDAETLEKIQDLSAKEFAEIIKNSNYFNGEQIRLFACEAGKFEDGLAQQLADELGVNVLAPVDVVYVDNAGYSVVASTQLMAEIKMSQMASENKFWTFDGWKLFKPKG